MSILSMWRAWALLSAIPFGLALSAGSALAITGSFSYPIDALRGSSDGAPEELLGTGTSSVEFEFMLPQTYSNNGTVRIALYLTALNAPCAARIVPDSLGRRRPGMPARANASGLQAEDHGTTVDFPAGSFVVVEKVFTLNPESGFPGQRKGDGIFVGFKRTANHAADTCNGSVFLMHIDVRYPMQ